MKRIVLLLTTWALTQGLSQKEVTQENFIKLASLKIDNEISAEISSFPDLNERKLSSVHITFQGKENSTLKSISLLSFDAQMPDHNHGMVTKASAPKKLETKENQKLTYLIEGVKLHMPGKWVLHIKVAGPEGEKLHTLPIDIKL